jgi:translation initiation factor IF-2
MAKTEDAKKTKYRPPIVTFMGHVDHGKTSILDAIRHTNVQEGEYGGITQHIGAYQVTHNNQKITFIDTPGHEAFTQMRARGGRVADIVVLVVAADAGVQPQTKEAIAHARAGGSQIIVAINKMDLPAADSQKVKQQLAQENIMVEDWGGDTICVEVSAKTKENLNQLLDAILLVSEMKELKYLPAAELEAMIIESKKDAKKGVLVSCVVRAGTLKLRDQVVASGQRAKIKSMVNDKGEQMQTADPGTPVEIMGFKETPQVGDLIVEEGSELADLAVDEAREEIIGQDTRKVVAIVLRADTQGTLEAVKASLAEMITSTVGLTFSIKFLLATTGDITDSDIMLAQSGDGIVIGFNVKVPPYLKDLARDLGVIVKSYQTIYELIDEVGDLLEGSAIREEEKIKGRAQVLKIFKLTSGDKIIGCKVEAGSLKVKNSIAIYDKNPIDLTNEDQPLHKAKIKKIKSGKDEIEVAGKNNECGLLLKPQYEEIEKGMWIEVI